jgi:hypothetical protein
MLSIDLDDEIGRRASEVAAAQGKTLEEFVGEVLRVALSPGEHAYLSKRNGLAVIQVPQQTPRIDPSEVQRIIQEEGL